MSEYVATRTRRLGLLALICATFLVSITTQASLNPSSPPEVLFTSTKTNWHPDFAFDPVTNLGLVVFRNDSRLRGVYVEPDGEAASAMFSLTTSDVQFSRVAARTNSGTGGFLVTFYISGIKRAMFLHPNSSTPIGPVTIGASDYELWGGGIAYVPGHDTFLVVSPKDDHTWVNTVRVSGGTLVVSSPVRVTQSTSDCGANEDLKHGEIAWDAEHGIALVVGLRDFTSCRTSSDTSNGGVWARRLSYNGSTISPLGSMAWLIKGGSHEDAKVVYSDLLNRFIAVWVTYGGSVRPVLKRSIDSDDGSLGTTRVILPPNTSNSSVADDKFGRNRQLGLAYNPFTGRFLLGVRGNDSSSSEGSAPAFALELDTNGEAVPRSLIEYLPHDAKDPWPRPVALPNSQNFLMVTKAPGHSQLEAVVISGNGAVGTSNWPLTSGSDYGSGGGGGGGEAPPPPPPSGTVTLTILNPGSGGRISGDGILCSPGSSGWCVKSMPAGTNFALTASPFSGYTFAGYTGSGCPSGASTSATVAMTTSKTCTASFTPSGGGGGGEEPIPPPPSGSVTLRIVNPNPGGRVTGDGILCSPGSTGWCVKTMAVNTVFTLKATAFDGYVFAGWGGTGCPTGTATTVNVTMSTSKTCSATFVPGGGGGGSTPPPSGSVTLTIDNPGNPDVFSGRVSGDGILCSPGNVGWCSKTMPVNTVFAISASPGSGFFFEGWENAGCPAGAATPTTVTMNASKTCKANFSRR